MHKLAYSIERGLHRAPCEVMASRIMMPNLSRTLTSTKGVNGYSEGSHAAKLKFHRAGHIWLHKLANTLGLAAYDVRSNMGGPAVSGEVTLHGMRVYVQLYESCVGPRGLSILYRECNGRNDYCGLTNHSVRVEDLKNPRRADSFINTLAIWAGTTTIQD